ncbi:erythromycin esterase family protein [Bacillus atrophaeus]|uniref:erythromycin esterase family protein n=1 Tax=Bacillus atrophaeus TaxID=1452 RepID=UPI00077B0C96|nr:erythromycin esterase family protein [Bacillus atrophaeus]KXZ18756.1 hydrolase [Bacillus atrophaeus]MCY8839113.1 erythromycin esterase family protein [Bacillus atrophaeus]MCY9165400.1 erythromycin esterase family protein [Bacillus atrophaeus]MEC5222761.1 erythromycin esterase family protein [Bacillus atrophaeus]MED4578520.1 erythromycin esterase family protein [Bacillus atrophaeus]
MKSTLLKVTMLLLSICLLFTPLTASVQAAAGEKDIKHWERWIKRNAHPIEMSDSSQKDLRFLKNVLKDKRIVQLGETTHGAAEMNQTKVRLIKYLHEHLGYDVIAFESGFSDTNASYRNMDQLSARGLMKDSIFGVWHTEDVLELFQYIKEQKEKGDPLILTGFDIQDMPGKFNKSVHDLFKKVDPAKAEELTQAEDQYFSLVSDSSTLEEFHKKKVALVKEYSELLKFVDSHSSAFKDPRHPKSLDIVKHSLQLRMEIMETYLLQEMREKLEIYPEPDQMENLTFFLRDKMMAEQLEWVAEELYPDKKIMVWGHNYHLRKQNTKVIKDWIQISGPNMGDYLPERIKKQTYTIGIYAYSGESLGNDGTIAPVNSSHQPTSLEALLKSARHPYTFVDFLHTKNRKGTSWIYTPRTALYWGNNEEEMILKEQYDGVIWIEHISPSVII